jgi:hypothetical protein
MFSPADIITASVLKHDEMAAVCRNGDAWRLLAPPDGWQRTYTPGGADHTDIFARFQREAYIPASEEAKIRMDRQVRQAGGDPTDATVWPPKGYNDEDWTRFVQEALYEKSQAWLEQEHPGARIYFDREPARLQRWRNPPQAYRPRQDPEVPTGRPGRSGLSDQRGVREDPPRLTDPEDDGQLEERGGSYDADDQPLIDFDGYGI